MSVQIRIATCRAWYRGVVPDLYEPSCSSSIITKPKSGTGAKIPLRAPITILASLFMMRFHSFNFWLPVNPECKTATVFPNRSITASITWWVKLISGTKTITSLNNSFELETKTEKNTVESVNRDNLLNINLDESLLNNLKIDEGKLTFSVTSSNINKVLNYKDLVISGDAEFELSFTNKKISNIKIMLVTASNKNVEVNISYLY